jgi:NADH dehydrogenase FAD-containing subunit
LVIATGGRYQNTAKLVNESVPFEDYPIVSMNDGESVMRQLERLAAAKSVAVIGGGPTGLEVAVEIAEAYPEKKVTIINSRPTLMPRHSPAAQEAAMREVSKYPNINLVLGKRVAAIAPNGNAITNDEHVIDSHVIFLASGLTPNSEFMRPHMSHTLDESGYIRVNPYLQVDGFSNVFALGDVSSADSAKLVMVRTKHFVI